MEIQCLLPSNVIPNGVKSLHLSYKSSPITMGMIPETTDTLFIDNQYPLSTESLPRNLKKLELTGYNTELVPGILPNQLKTLVLMSYNKPIAEGTLPETIEQLYLTQCNQELKANQLPPSIKRLVFSSINYSKMINSVFPPNLEILNIHKIPANSKLLGNLLHLKKLYIGNIDCQIIDIQFPPLLEKLSIVSLFDDKIKISRNTFPQGLKSFSLEFCSSELTLEWLQLLPNGIESMKLPSTITTLKVGLLPKSLKKIRVGLIYSDPLKAGVFPEGLEILRLSGLQEKSLTKYMIPSTLKHIYLSHSIDKNWILKICKLPFYCIIHSNNYY
ncbi:hypothetical protein DLAC_03598 [Tieghemostelium lacteum]|uniref:Uncharacterized protein n=1 Tax=Tieghemostelium lacteum TaxID=361077 RepID=A0A152A0R5_TIELA|nr:hypothetical protein DLAC_03598 [Tieghemostelium lacteum]|eukprot:KYQ99660.1 hypothetical protein DLAC_03598 [Tieghemostelium lacteum]